jgi:hypothetical protein
MEREDLLCAPVAARFFADVREVPPSNMAAVTTISVDLVMTLSPMIDKQSSYGLSGLLSSGTMRRPMLLPQ